MKDENLNQAIIAYLGKAGSAAYPGKDEVAVIAVAAKADSNPVELLAKVRAIDTEFMAIEIDWSSNTLEEGGDEAKRVMASRYPNLDEDALEALRWKFTYDLR
ncbi:MAG: hypothetical protein V4611_04285 [Patescibacteria group bacterium]